MGLFTKALSDVGGYALDKTKQVGQKAKITMSLESEISSLEQLYNALGRAYFERHRNDPAPDVAEQVAAIALSLQRVDDHKRQLEDIDRGGVKCGGCGTIVPSDAAFCPSCGQPIEKQKSVGDDQPAMAKEKPENNIPDAACPYCGSPNAAGAEVCSTCGSPIV